MTLRSLRWLLAAALALGPLTLVHGDAIGGVEPQPKKKCCVPATATGPGGNDCPAPPCRPTVVCNGLIVTGSWGTGGCQVTNLEESTCTSTDTDDVYRPIVQCSPVACTMDDGTAGQTCGWVQIGTSTTEKQDNVKSCNGTPCS